MRRRLPFYVGAVLALVLVITTFGLTRRADLDTQIQTRICVVGTNGSLRYAAATINTRTNDTIDAESRQPFRRVYPSSYPPYAARAPFFRNNEPIRLQTRRYIKYGLPRVIEVRDLDLYRRAPQFRGVPIFLGIGGAPPTELVYLPTRVGCEFQAYLSEVKGADLPAE